MSDDEKSLRKLDRFLVCENLVNLWPDATPSALPLHFSDHNTLILITSASNFGSISFIIFNSWFELPGFEEAVTADSLHQCTETEADKRLAEKLKNIKKAIKM